MKCWGISKATLHRKVRQENSLGRQILELLPAGGPVEGLITKGQACLVPRLC